MRKFYVPPVPVRDYSVPVQIGIVRTPSPVDAFVIEEVELAKGVKRVHVVNDIGILFNQQRLMQLSPMMLDSWLKMARQASPDDGLSDEQILTCIKSRYIQSTTDVYNYTRWLQQNIDGIISDAKARAAQQVEESASQQSTPAAE